MKQRLILSLCLVFTLLFAGRSDAEELDLTALLDSPKLKKLNSKVMCFYLTHPKSADYLYEGGRAIESVLEEYCLATERLIEKYPQERASTLAENRVANLGHFLSNRETFRKMGIFLFFGVYDLNSYQDERSWKELLKTQESILQHYITKEKLKEEKGSCAAACGEEISPVERLEYALMAKIKNFCQLSKDPFFHTTLYEFIRESKSREDLLKLFAPLRDETLIDEELGEVVSEAEEAFESVNEVMWIKLKAEAKKYIERTESLERFIDITSDTFDIPHLPERFKEMEKS
ncbi:MAG: hypothetical protein K1060chlam2_00138 [Chlamydiae bacterium]|nr:hypothetical protein [Chlamydiota bacterium]